MLNYLRNIAISLTATASLALGVGTPASAATFYDAKAQVLLDNSQPDLLAFSSRNYTGNLFITSSRAGGQRTVHSTRFTLFNRYNKEACTGRATVIERGWGRDRFQVTMHFDGMVPGYSKCGKAGRTETYTLK